MDIFEEVEFRRKALKVEKGELCEVAGIHRNSYRVAVGRKKGSVLAISAMLDHLGARLIVISK